MVCWLVHLFGWFICLAGWLLFVCWGVCYYCLSVCLSGWWAYEIDIVGWVLGRNCTCGGFDIVGWSSQYFLQERLKKKDRKQHLGKAHNVTLIKMSVCLSVLYVCCCCCWLFFTCLVYLFIVFFNRFLFVVMQDYEMRFYPESKWVSTTIIGADYKSATEEGFDKLFNYISGQNSESKHTVPL